MGALNFIIKVKHWIKDNLLHFLEPESLIVKMVKKLVPYEHVPYDCRFHFCILFRFSRIYLKIPLKCRKYPIKKVRSFINSYSLHNGKYVVPYVTVTCPIRYGDLSHMFKIIIVNLFDIEMRLCYILITKIYYWNYFHSFQYVVAYFT